jgi:nucleoside-diphosphate-sugar epimerase
MHYFVTGATGFLGGYVTSHLLEAGHEVTALVRTREQARAIAPYGVRPHIGTVVEKESMRPGMRRVDGVVHTAGHRIAFPDRDMMRAVNVDGTRHVLELMDELSIPKGIYTSGISVLGDTKGRVLIEVIQPARAQPTHYDRVRAEALFDVAQPMMRRGLPLTVLLPGIVYGPGDTSTMADLFRRFILGKMATVPSRTAYCWAHVDDVAQAHVLGLQFGRPGKMYVTGGPQHRLREALEVAAGVVGRRAPPIPVPGALHWPGAALTRALSFVVPRLRLTADRLRVATGVTYLADDAAARREIGFAPRSLAEGLPDAVRALLQDVFESV